MKYLLLPIFWIRQTLQRWPLWWLGLLLAGICLWVVFYTYQASERMVRQYATESAQAHAVSLTQFRNFYTDQIVPRAMEAG